MASQAVPRKLWQHPCPASTNIGRFRDTLERHTGKSFPTFHDLHRYSIQHRSSFWDFCWGYFQLIHEGLYDVVVDETAPIDTIPHWFDGVRLNFAENILFSSDAGDRLRGKEDDKVAVVEVREAGAEGATYVTWKELRNMTGRLVQALKAHGVKRGDRIAVCASNSVDTLLVFLAATALGAIFSSMSTDMGTRGLLDRLLQIKPVCLFMDDFAVYTDISDVPKACTLDDFLAKAPHDRLEFARVRFRDPFLVVYSSGTTGQPKCIIHSVGGVLLNAHKEGGLHQEMRSDSVILQYTTTGWIMYLAQVQGLLFGARIILYDGNPFLPHVSVLIELAAKERPAVSAAGHEHRNGAARFPFRMVLRCRLPPNVRLNNISGGTDIAGSFGTGNALLPVYVGGCAGLSLGIPVEVYDPSIDRGGAKGVAVADGIPGELVATAAFPNMPVGFWGQDGDKRYHQAYFAEFDRVWTHGDFVSIHPTTKQLFFHGRADGVLNPSGVRFGSSEIYQVIESDFADEVEDSLCVSQRRPSDNDERVVLFLKMKPNTTFNADLTKRVRAGIRKRMSARHVPSYIFPTPEIPTTVNFKKVELPVKQIISGVHIQPSSTLANPDCLKYYVQFFDIEKMAARESRL
ncbi:hypothetical protein N7444_003783 [Penicillium canescens]|nr:hypothetical protein N7444_003783 [Penicillium canescens]